MPDANVSSCVLNILGSFSNSLGLFKKLRDSRRQRRRWKKDGKLDEEEQRLSRSLRQGPEDIGREYQNSIHAAGDHFAIGDAIAQTSLAEILLRLNVGLVGIITSFVNSDKNSVKLDYQGLTDLSERSRVDTCRTLRQLFKRMTQLRAPLALKEEAEEEATNLSSNISRDTRGDRKRPPRKTPAATAAKSTKVRGPMLATVVIENSNKPPQIAVVKPSERRKKSQSSSSSGSGGSSLSKIRSQSHVVLAAPASGGDAEKAVEPPPRPAAQRSNTAPVAPKPRRKQSAMDMTKQSPPLPSDKIRATRSTPRLQSTLQASDPLPPMPNTAPLPAVSTLDLPPRRRKPTPTYYSIASDSTRLGEIPMDRWAVPPDFDRMSVLNREAERNGWPIDPQEARPKRNGFLRLFGRRSS